MARLFDDASSHYLSRATAVVTAAPFTMVGWCRPDTNGVSVFPLAIGKSDSSLNWWTVGLEASGSGQRVYADILNNQMPITGAYTVGAWMHVGLVEASSTDHRVYRDGPTNKATSSASLSPSGVDRTGVGALVRAGTAQNHFSGDIAEVAFWSVALTDEEMAALAKGFSPRLIRPASLVAYWPIYGNSSPEPDRWKSGQDLTLNGSPAKSDHPRVYGRSHAKVATPYANPTAPATPGTPSPSDGATGVAPTALTWAAIGATSYDVYFGTSVTPSLVSSGQAGASYVPTIADGITYYWQIVAINGVGSTTGPVWSFTAQKPATPSTPSPSDGAIDQGASPTLTWTSARATSYDVYFGTSLTLVSTGQAGATYTPAGPLTGQTTYLWQIVAHNAAGSTGGPIWSFTTRSLSALVMTIAGVTPHTRVAGLSIHDLLNEAPNTCSFTVDTTAPTVGQDVQIGLGSLATADVIFAGTIISVEQVYEGVPANLAWRVTCQDYTRTINRLKVRTRYAQQSATDIALDLVASYTTGFTDDDIEAGLPTVTGGIDFTDEEPLTCLARLATRIGGYSDVGYGKNVRLFLTESSAAPDPLDAGSPSLMVDPPVTSHVDVSQIRTRTFVEGGGANATASVSAGEPYLPIEDPQWYDEAAGGVVVSGPQRIAYTGVVAGGAGALVGTTVTPTNGPALTPRAAAGLTAGVYGWAATFTTASGETKPGPTTSLTLGGAVSPPPSAPTATKAFGGNLSSGNYRWKTAFLTALGETLASGASSTLVLDEVAAPTSIGTATPVYPPAGLMDFSAIYGYKYTFSNGSVETVPSPAAVTGNTLGNSSVTMTKAGLQSPPAGFSRKFYRTEGNGSTYKRMVDSIDGFSSEDATYLYDSQGDGGLDSTAPTVSTATYRSAVLGLPVSANPLVTHVRIYRTEENGSTWKKVADVTNGTATYTDTLADGGLGSAELSVATAVSLAADLSGIPLGPSGTTGRKLYRTVVGGSTLKLLATIANNTATTYTDTTADGSLGATAPATDTSGLVTQTGDVPAGSTSILITSSAPFRSAGGWAFIGALPVRYTGLSGDALTGVPATGVGALGTTVRYGSEVIAAAMLIGIPTSSTGSILYDILAGDPVNILVQCDDVDAQDDLADLEGGDSDGIYEHVMQDRRLSISEARAVGDADLALFSRPITTITYATRDPKTRSGKTIHIDLPSLDLLGDFIIQEVTIDQIDVSPLTYPRYTVTASSVRFSFEDVLRQLQLTA